MSHPETVKANEPRTEGPKFDTWPASLPQITYIVEDFGSLCVTCANAHAADIPRESSRDQDAQWRVVGAQLNDEPTICDHCYRLIMPVNL